MKEKDIKNISITFVIILLLANLSSIASAEIKGSIVISDIIKDKIERERLEIEAMKQERIRNRSIEYGIPGAIREEAQVRERIRIEVYPSQVVEKTETCKDFCGDGICQRFVCLAIGCPCPETEETCPKDCSMSREEIQNPATAFCKRYGYIYKTEKTSKGEVGYCIMPNGEVCDEWEFYRGECGNRYRNAVNLELGNETQNIEFDPEKGVEIKSKKLEVIGAIPIFTARVRSITTENMNKEAIRITCRERIKLRYCKEIAEEDCKKLLKEMFEKECLENLPREIEIEEIPINIDVNNEAKTISIQTGNLTIRTRHRLHIIERGLFIETPHKNISINVIPSVAVQVIMTREPIDKIENAELDIENETNAIYKIEGNRKARFLGIIPVELKIKARVNVETGDVTSIEKPWWSFLTIR